MSKNLPLQPPLRLSRLARRRGAALVIILAFVVLLTVLVVAYFSYAALQRQISQAGFNQTAAEIFAQGAVNTIISDLKQEIVAGSTNLSTNTAVYQVYYPLSAIHAAPALVGSTGTNGLENLLKRSASGQAFYPGGPSRAATASTTNASQNGRFLPTDRWNATLLLPKATTNTTDLTPTNTFIPPDWVLVARDGSNPTNWNNNMRWNPTNNTSVVGRYAYAIYDEGGLLDINVAGHPPGSSTNFTADKGGLAYADLTTLPGMTTNVVTALVGWRNIATAQPDGAFPSYTFDDAAKTNFFNFVRSNTSGFLRTANTNITAAKQTDHQFVSRQQLIQFLTKGIAANDSEKAALQNALQYLGTFSRDLEQPSFRPDPNRPKNTLSPVGNTAVGNGNDTYDATGQKQDEVNPALLTIRDTNGDPILKRRFPLSRLAMLADPVSADAAKVKQYFGLTWDNAEKRWVYDHGDPAKIYSLSDIPSGREPDFFEILKAAIHCDSLGKQMAGLDNLGTPHAANGSLIDGQIHNQIVQIAANILDQFDSDSYPTHFVFNGRGFYGIENLPYLAGWQQMWYRMRALTSSDIATPCPDSGTTYETAVMIQPIIWNPHAPDANLNPPNVPVDFRIVAGSLTDTAVTVPFRPQVAKAWWTTDEHMQSTFPATPTYASANGMSLTSGSLYAFPNALIDPNYSILTFSTGPADTAFREPYRLRAINDPPGSNARNDAGYPDGKLTVGADAALMAADGNAIEAIGFYCGKCWTGPSIDQSNTQKWLSVGGVNRDFKLKLQYKSSSGAWMTYDVIEDIYNASGNISTLDNTGTGANQRAFRTCFRADPRTDRWGLFHLATFPSNNSSDTPSGTSPLLSPPLDNGVDGGFGNNKQPHYFLPQGTTLKPNANTTYLTSGAAGGAAAPGWLNSNLYCVTDLMVNMPRTPNANPNSGTKTTGSTPLPPGEKYFYTDPDGVFRRSSGWNFSGVDGLPLYTANGKYDSRPVILNRPFRSVAELGYAFRGMAWKELDFFTPESGDAALLDAFCLTELDSPPSNVTVAGRVNLNTKQPKVLQALVHGVSKAEGGSLTAAEALSAAQALVNWTTDTNSMTSGILNKGPLRNRSELVGKYVTNVPYSPTVGGLTGGQSPILDGSKTYQGFSSVLTSAGIFTNSPDPNIQRRCGSVIRALADAGNTRTWNLLIDVVAQVGRYPLSANADLSKFVVEGETRYWVHLAIDRSTGKVIAQQIEFVSE